MPKIAKIAGYRFEVETPIEINRVATLLTKEPGTLRWLETLRTTDVLYDVGANIGVYTIVAAKRGVRVVAIEPHVPTAASLLRNIAQNGLAVNHAGGGGELVTVLTVALSDAAGFADFNYRSTEAGASGHQLGHTVGEDGVLFVPTARERKYALRLDTLNGLAGVPAPTAVKIDVDGNELDVVQGMTSLLLRTVQVEVRPRTDAAIQAVLEAAGLQLVERHYTHSGQLAIDRGADPLSIPHNVVYARR